MTVKLARTQKECEEITKRLYDEIETRIMTVCSKNSLLAYPTLGVKLK